jgi:hypothetical protein
MNALAIFNRIKSLAMDEFRLASAAIRKKGAQRFLRIFLIAAAPALMSYFLLYLPSQKRLALLDTQLASARAADQFSGQYKDLQAKLRGVYDRLLTAKEMEGWLLNRVRRTLGDENLVTNSIAPPQETETAGITYQRLKIALDIKFPQLISWIQKIESRSPYVRLTVLDMVKKDIGIATVQCEVTTAVATHREGL